MWLSSFVMRNYRFYLHKIQWRRCNKHNDTVAKTMFDSTKVTVGKHSYGHLNIFEWGVDKERLDIGNYVSIAESVKFILGGNHSTRGFSTFPFSAKAGIDKKIDAQTKGEVVVEDDVWIGMEVVILSGVRIGKGAVIAAGSIVTNDVEPYSIVGGNPARKIKSRISDTEKEIASKIDFSLIDLSLINEENIVSFYNEPNRADLEVIKKTYSTNEFMNQDKL